MYLSSRPRAPGEDAKSQQVSAGSKGRRGRPTVSRNVLFLGLTSMFTDISSEMVTAVLPLYLTLGLGLGPLGFGAFDGFYQAVTAVLPLAGGLAADRWRRHKEVATTGYGLSAACKLGLVAAVGSTGPTVAILSLDRVGKGLRTAPRDALISLSSTPARLAESFGVHRAFDTIGALIGPVVAFGLLHLVPDGYDTVFVTSFCVALVGVAVLATFVENPALKGVPERSGRGTPAASATTSTGGRASLAPVAALGLLLRLPGYRALLLAGSVLGLVTLSDAFLYLTFQQRSTLTNEMFPLLYVGSATVYLLLAVPVGRFADRVGRVPVLVAGHLPLLGAYFVLLKEGPRTPRLILLLLLVGLHYAATSGVLMAVASTIVPTELRTFGIALLASTIALSKAASSIGFGALWSWWGSHVAIAVYIAGLVVAVLTAAQLLRRATSEH